MRIREVIGYSTMSNIVFFNGSYIPKDQVVISPDDRGFLFGDGVYDVTLSYKGRLFRRQDHLLRMKNGLKSLEIEGVDVDGLWDAALEVIKANGLEDADLAVYFQATRGVAKRTHCFPKEQVPPTTYVAVSPFVQKGDSFNGSPIITIPDTRWSRCDIKSVCLLPNCLANQRAQEVGAHEGVFVRDGFLLEGAGSSVFAIFDGVICTAPLTNYVLPGVTRKVVLELCAEAGIPTSEESIFYENISEASEVFLAGTTTEVVPVISIDGRPVGDGHPGPIVQRLVKLFREYAHDS